MQTTKTLHGCGRLLNVPEAAARLADGGSYTVAGEAALLKQLPRGNWIGGTIPYFMGEQGGESSREKVFLTPVERPGGEPFIRSYDAHSISRVCSDAPDQGYTLLIVPAFSAVHSEFARNAPNFDEMFLKPLAGWVSGVHLDDLGKSAPATIDGSSGEFDSARAVALHVPLPPHLYARIDIINGMEQGDGDRIRFPATGFDAGDCLVNDIPANLAEYMDEVGADLRLPLVADYCGAMINVSLKRVDEPNRRVEFYAPVFEGIEYRFARAPGTLPAIGGDAGGRASFSCNCILNYLYGNLEGRRTGLFTGPMTFGEIAYLLLNQTLVHLSIEQA